MGWGEAFTKTPLGRAVMVLRGVVDDDTCDYDHHGYCQTHFHLPHETPCPMEKAREFLKEIHS